jgi:hypothetical protein
MSHHRFRFSKGREYAFFHEDVHLLLVDFERDEKKELFLISAVEEDGTFLLEYPGELFTEQLQELIKSIFFIQVKEESQEGRYVLGAFFTYDRKEYALYYDREDTNNAELIFFRATATGLGDYELVNIHDQAEYSEVVEHITERYNSFMQME